MTPIAEMTSKPIIISPALSVTPVASAAPTRPATPPSAMSLPEVRTAGACARVQAPAVHASTSASASAVAVGIVPARAMAPSVDQKIASLRRRASSDRRR